MASQPDVDNAEDEQPPEEEQQEQEQQAEAQQEEEEKNPERSDDEQTSDGDDIREHDLVGTRRISPGELPTLQLIENKTAGLFAIELSHLLNLEANVFADPQGICKFGDLVPQLESPGCLNFLQFEALNGPGLLTIDYELFFGVLEHLFGGEQDLPIDNQADTIVRARFSEIEQRVVRRIVRLFGRSMEEAWRPIVPLTVRHIRIETDPTNITIANPGEWVVHTVYNIEMGDLEGNLIFALPIDLLDDYQERLASGRYEERGSGGRPWEEIMRSHFRKVPMEIVAELGESSLTLRELLELEEGQILRLDQSSEQPITVTMGGLPKYRAQVTVYDGNLAIELESLHEDTEI